mmetsp:Transcript_28802/g.82801  ORF Transcript_28802/g.82801 Transcript_28802/m.82801 type:complete len:548 (-) Transcript_28802:382-2025(-)
MPDYKLAVNAENKATELPLLRVTGSVQQNPHMRAFWASTISFFIAFLGWFALTPLGPEVAHSMGICENQLFPPAENPARKAFLKFKHLDTAELYCRYGKNHADNPTDCNEPPVNSSSGSKYNADVLPKCLCTSGTKCKTTLTDGGVASVASTIFMRVLLGTLLERFGPVNVQTLLMLYGALWVGVSAAITDPWNYIMIRFFIGAAGATFVTNQFWCSLMFAPAIVGTANATAAGWGNLGGGVTQIFVGVVLFQTFSSAGLEAGTAWRVSMLVPAMLFVVCAVCMKLLCWDTPTAKRFHPSETGKTKGASCWDYVEVLKDPRVIVMIFQYSACFGTELAMNNQLATHFRTYFQMKRAAASTLAGCFGLMNLFARSLGGISSDLLFAKFGFRGRIWAQFLALFFEGIFLFVFGMVNNEQPWYAALAVLIFFSLFVQMAEGTSYGIVPFMNRQQLAVVSALVGAGGNLGAVIAGKAFYAPIEDDLLPFKVHAAYVLFFALLSPLYYWPEHGGMFCGPREDAAQERKDSDSTNEGEAAKGEAAQGEGGTSV